MKKLLLEDFVIGAVFGLFLAPWIGLWAIPVAVLSGGLWSIGGQYGHSKRFAIPFIWCGGVEIVHHYHWIWLGLLPAIFVFTLGYGIPLYSSYPDDYEAGSALGQFWYKKFRGNTFYANLFTRGTIYMLLILCYLPLLWLK